MSAIMLLIALLLLLGAVRLLQRLTRRKVPAHRVRDLRIRLRLKMRPGRGHATLFELWVYYSRFAAWRKSRRVRPSLSAWARFRRPSATSIRIGRAQYGHRLRVPLEESLLVLAPPRQYKTAFAADVALRYPGSIVSTSVKADVWEFTSGHRQKIGPCEVFSPQGIGGLHSTFAWSPTSGCRVAEVASRRGAAFAGAVSVKSVDGDSFWSSQATELMTAAFMAADLAGGDLRLVARFLSGTGEDAERILLAAGAPDQAASIAALRSPAEKTVSTIKLILNKSLSFLGDPALAASVLPHGDEFDIKSFLLASGSMYCVAEAQSTDAPVAPVMACLLNEVHHTAKMLGSKMPGGRMDPPVGFILDEVANVAPCAINVWGADSGGRNIQLLVIAHGFGQLRDRWGADGARVISDTASVRLFLPGITDVTTLEEASKLCGQFAMEEQGVDRHERHDIMTPSMIRQLPAGRALVIRGGHAPLVATLPRVWRDPIYKRARRRGEAVAVVEPVAQRPVTALVPALVVSQPDAWDGPVDDPFEWEES